MDKRTTHTAHLHMPHLSIHDPRVWVMTAVGAFIIFVIVATIATENIRSGILATPFYGPYWPVYTNG